MLHDLEDCYKTLELEPGASSDEIKRSYRELVKVWHPDRFAGNQRLQQKAQEKLKQINLAYERICTAKTNSTTPAAGPSGDTASRTKQDQNVRRPYASSSPRSGLGSQQNMPQQSPYAPPM